MDRRAPLWGFPAHDLKVALVNDEEISEDLDSDNLQKRRLAQLEAMESWEIEALIELMRTTTHLPRLQMHFRQHRHEFGAETIEDYERLFREHVRRNDLQHFTFIRPETDDVRWYSVDPATGSVAIYNETRVRYWSFFRNRNVLKFLNGFRGYWVEVFRHEDDWQFRSW